MRSKALRNRSLALTAATLVAVLLGSTDAAHARTESLQWGYSDPGLVTGFKVYFGDVSRDSSGGYANVVDVGKPAPDGQGFFNYDLQVPTSLEGVPLYIAVTAYDAQQESDYSVERLRQPPAGGGTTSTGTGTPPPAGTIFSEDFEAMAVGTAVPGWLDTGPNDSLVEDDSLFSVVNDSGNQVFETSSTATNIHSHYVAGDSSSWTAYEYRGRMRFTSDTGGVGVTAYSLYPQADVYYRLRRYDGSPSFELEMHPHVDCAVPNTGVPTSAGVWYEFSLQVEPATGQNVVRAKVWPQGSAEPTTWQAVCTDTSASRPTAGTIGVWSMGAGTKEWDDLQVLPLDGSSGSATVLGVPGTPYLVP